MDEYIKRENVLTKIDEFAKQNIAHGFPVDVFDIEMMKKMVEKLPAADVAPVVHGHWTTECYNIPICSICGTYVSKDVYNSEDFTPKFCPNCGAKMDEEVNYDD